uniref:Uncharacterized protein n=1 Tax=Timema tahoe TaxID=61484 RepID=A0A7R9IKE6_9NEOP|nr:unnamed protein product [Timema tahoe]
MDVSALFGIEPETLVSHVSPPSRPFDRVNGFIEFYKDCRLAMFPEDENVCCGREDQMTLRTAVPVALSPLYPNSKLDIGIVEMGDLVYVRSISAACGVACVTDS